MRPIHVIYIFLTIILSGQLVFASPNYLNVYTRIAQPNGTLLEEASVQFRFTVVDPVGTCVIYIEDFSNINMAASKGLVSIGLGTGTKTYPAGPFTMNQVFSNFASPVFNCQSGGTYTAASTDQRKLIMQFNDGTGWQTVPPMTVNSVPWAMEAFTAQMLGAFNASDYLRTAQLTACNPGEAVHFNGTAFTCLTSLAGSLSNGGNALGAAMTIGTNDSNALNFETGGLPRVTIDATGNMGVGVTNPNGVFETNAAGAKTATYIGNSISNTATSATNAISKTGLDVQSSGVWNGVSATNVGLNVNVSGGTTNYAALFNGGNVGVGTTTPAAKLDVAGDVKVGNSSAVCSATTKGSIRYNDATSVLEFCNGTSWNLVQAAACSDATPNSFTFTDQSNQTTTTQITSDIVQVSSFNCTVPVTISGVGTPQFQICSDVVCGTIVQGWTSAPSSIVSGQYIQIRQTTDAAGGAPTTATVIIGGTASIWTVSTAGGDCVATTPPIGTVCADDTVYAGLSPNGNAKMFTTRCDFGQTWTGAICSGTATKQTWNNGSSSWTYTNIESNITGKANSAALHILADAGAPYNAVDVCENLNLNGQTDWYLPASSELDVLYSNRMTIRNFDLGGIRYWSSTDSRGGSNNFNHIATVVRFSDGANYQETKFGLYNVRCVRR